MSFSEKAAPAFHAPRRRIAATVAAAATDDDDGDEDEDDGESAEKDEDDEKEWLLQPLYMVSGGTTVGSTMTCVSWRPPVVLGKPR